MSPTDTASLPASKLMQTKHLFVPLPLLPWLKQNVSARAPPTEALRSFSVPLANSDSS